MKATPIQIFELLLKSSKLPQPVREKKFHPIRRWRFDFAWPENLVAVEIDGGGYGFRCRSCRGVGKTRVQNGGFIRCRSCQGFGRMTGGHNSITGTSKDAEKRNAAVLLGWRVLTFTTRMLEHDPKACIETVEIALSGKQYAPIGK